jgi:hypothetical protein
MLACVIESAQDNGSYFWDMALFLDLIYSPVEQKVDASSG